MGKVIQLLDKIRNASDLDLFNRFNHITRVQAVRDYLGTKEDKGLTVEVRLYAEEIVNRMALRNAKVIKIHEEEL